MSLRLRFRDEALAEIRDTADWYDRQRRGLGDDFLEALQVRLAELVDSPGLGGRLPGAAREVLARRVLLSRFPYVVVFVEAEGELRVIAVMHGKRKPGYWLKRLSK